MEIDLPRITVLGPERPAPVLPEVLERLAIRGPLALISAGWRYDELRDEPLREALGRPLHNLGLYEAFRDLERHAPELIAVYARKQHELKRIKDRYRSAIVPAMHECQTLYTPDPGCRWLALSIRHLQEIDAIFLEEADALHRSFDSAADPRDHPRVRAHAERMRDTMDGCDAVLLAGGHVGVLRNRLSFFGFEHLLRDRAIIAWSAGAMALTDRVLLFHDYTNWGVGIAEVLDRGLGLLHDVVFLPHCRDRLDLDHAQNVAILARRVAPARAIGLLNGAVLLDGLLPVSAVPDAALELCVDGAVRPLGGLHADDA